jgi:hypothetical protein
MFNDHTLMHQAVDGRGRRHRVLEDLLSLGEWQIACQQEAPRALSVPPTI